MSGNAVTEVLNFKRNISSIKTLPLKIQLSQRTIPIIPEAVLTYMKYNGDILQKECYTASNEVKGSMGVGAIEHQFGQNFEHMQVDGM